MEKRPEIRSEDVDLPGFRPLMERLAAVCTERGASRHSIISALARDLLLGHIYGLDIPRATRDVDVAVAIGSWKQYEAVRQALQVEHGFGPGREAQRLRREGMAPLDLVPFGGLEEPPGLVHWPPDQARAMSTLGLQEAYETAAVVWLDGELPLKVASLEGQGLLKLIAWSERPYERPEDAQDLCLLMQSYYDARSELVYEEHLDLFGDEHFDRDAVSARVYGREAAALLKKSPDLRSAIFKALDGQLVDPEASRLTQEMGRRCIFDVGRRFQSLIAFREGLREGLAR